MKEQLALMAYKIADEYITKLIGLNKEVDEKRSTVEEEYRKVAEIQSALKAQVEDNNRTTRLLKEKLLTEQEKVIALQSELHTQTAQMGAAKRDFEFKRDKVGKELQNIEADRAILAEATRKARDMEDKYLKAKQDVDKQRQEVEERARAVEISKKDVEIREKKVVEDRTEVDERMVEAGEVERKLKDRAKKLDLVERKLALKKESDG